MLMINKLHRFRSVRFINLKELLVMLLMHLQKVHVMMIMNMIIIVIATKKDLFDANAL